MKILSKLFLLIALVGFFPAHAAPKRVATVSVSTSASAAVQLPKGSDVVLFCTVVAFVAFGADSTTSATTTDFPLFANDRWDDRTTPGLNWVSFITSSGTGTCYVFQVIK